MSNPNNDLWRELEWVPSSEQIEKFTKLQELLENWNKLLNLTRLTRGNDYWISQVFDSLLPFKKELNLPPKELNCIDVGSGCGFPGFAIAIAFPKAKVTLVDSTEKKTKFLNHVSIDLDLQSQIIVRNERIETTGQKFLLRGSYDLAMVRAVASAPVVAEYIIPLLNPNGKGIIYRGKWEEVDEKDLLIALTKLNGNLTGVSKYFLPDNRGKRHIIKITPKGNCPKKYPRSIGKPSKNPLNT